MQHFIVLLLICATTCSYGQLNLTNTQDIDTDRYKDIKGSPYYFEEAQPAKFTLRGNSNPYDVMLNINIYEKEVEVYDGDKYAAFDFKSVEKIETTGNKHVVITPKEKHLMYTLFDNGSTSLSDEPSIRIETKTFRPPGKIIEKQSFVVKRLYKLRTADKSQSINLNKKSIQKALGKDAVALAKKNKLNLKSEEDVVRLFLLMHD